MVEYRGRIAPSPTGYLHVGHAITFWRAQERARAAGGSLILRIEDLDSQRCAPEFREAIIQDLKWFGLDWDEGPDVGGPNKPYFQSERFALYRDAWQRLRKADLIYPCVCSRKDVLDAAIAPHDENDEPIYPGTCRPADEHLLPEPAEPGGAHWRFRVPDGEMLRFVDSRVGEQTAIAGKDFGDFIIWRKDNVPAYQLAVAVDDAAMGVTEVVRGEDLLKSTFRQLLIYRALGAEPPEFRHAPLIMDESGKRLAKRDASLSLRSLRDTGATPEEIRARFL
jgi:glutamyl-queuosine tRNA(Asp) synthetase